MNYRVGCDIVHIPRIKKMLETPSSLTRVFTNDELRLSEKHHTGGTKGSEQHLEHLAGVFAAKEAIIKAAGITAGEWRNINISYDPNGRPVVRLNVGNISRSDITISHDGDYAMAVAIVEVD